jgi:hypothetical protein
VEQLTWKPWTAQGQKPKLLTAYRKGLRWARPEFVGSRVELLDEDKGGVFATALIISIKVCRFRDIDPLDHARQSSDMTIAQRLDILKMVYGGQYDMDTMTTVITIGDLQDKAPVPVSNLASIAA